MIPYGPTLAALTGIAALGWIDTRIMAVIICWNWSKRRRVPQ